MKIHNGLTYYRYNACYQNSYIFFSVRQFRFYFILDPKDARLATMRGIMDFDFGLLRDATIRRETFGEAKGDTFPVPIKIFKRKN